MLLKHLSPLSQQKLAAVAASSLMLAGTAAAITRIDHTCTSNSTSNSNNSSNKNSSAAVATSTPDNLNHDGHTCSTDTNRHKQQYKYKHKADRFMKQLHQLSSLTSFPFEKANYYYSSRPLHTTYCSESHRSSSGGGEEEEEDEECRSFNETLQHHRRLLSYYQQKWNWHNATSRIPTTSWPLDIPSDDELPSLEFDLTFCKSHRQRQKQKQKQNNSTEGTTNSKNDRYCSNLQFRIASFMLLQQDLATQKKGLQIIQQMVESESKSNPDAICAYATCLNDGRAGLEPNPTAAVSWWKIASDHYHHVQSTYELGVALYTGEGIVEDEALAVRYFRIAAENGHAGASYMLGDCLLDGVGVEKRDRGEALEWLVIAADLGHRGARSRVLAVLEKREGVSYGGFTDASRQTLAGSDDSTSSSRVWVGSEGEKGRDVDEEGTAQKEDNDDSKEITSGKDRDLREKSYSSRRPVTLEHRFTIGGGAKNPVVLARRRTIVTESRQYK